MPLRSKLKQKTKNSSCSHH